jgi:hypothetical protein
MTTRYIVTFDRIGRTRPERPVAFDVDGADDLAAAIWKHARPHLGSRDVEVVVDLDESRGGIYAGFRPVGPFTIETAR